MDKNMGSIDRALRFIVGVAIIGAGIAYESWWGLIGVVPIFFSTIGSCPVYTPLGIRTTCTKNKEAVESSEG